MTNKVKEKTIMKRSNGGGRDIARYISEANKEKVLERNRKYLSKRTRTKAPVPRDRNGPFNSIEENERGPSAQRTKARLLKRTRIKE